MDGCSAAGDTVDGYSDGESAVVRIPRLLENSRQSALRPTIIYLLKKKKILLPTADRLRCVFTFLTNFISGSLVIALFFWCFAWCGIKNELKKNTEEYSHLSGRMMMEIIWERGGWGGVRGDEETDRQAERQTERFQTNKKMEDDFCLLLVHFFFRKTLPKTTK